MLRSQRIGNAMAQRTRVVLALADGQAYHQIPDRLGCSPTSIALWKKRFPADRLGGMVSRHDGQPARVLTARLEAKILDASRRRGVRRQMDRIACIAERILLWVVYVAANLLAGEPQQ
jgi:hypothetical protein